MTPFTHHLSCAGSIATVHVQTIANLCPQAGKEQVSCSTCVYVDILIYISIYIYTYTYIYISLSLSMHRHLLCSAITFSNLPCPKQTTHPRHTDTSGMPVHQFLSQSSSSSLLPHWIMVYSEYNHQVTSQ